MNNRVIGAVFDNWQLSGENAFVSGDWSPITISTSDNFDFTGGDGGNGGDVGGGVYGNAPRNAIQLPRIVNWNLSLFKNVPVGGNRSAQPADHAGFDQVRVLDRREHRKTPVRRTGFLSATVELPSLPRKAAADARGSRGSDVGTSVGGSLPALRAGWLHGRRKTQVRVIFADRTCVFRLSRNPNAGRATVPAGAATRLAGRSLPIAGFASYPCHPRVSAATGDPCHPRPSAAKL